MLLQLEIRNIALIEHVCLEFGEGLNVLTGETGAGKSIIIDSLSAILGERISRDIIRTGADRAFVEAVFRVDNERFEDLFESLGIDAESDGTLILSRELSTAGKSVCRVNGRMVTASVLRDFSSRLVDLHGQHDSQSLLKTENHILLLDSFAGEQIASIKREYDDILDKYRQVRKKLRDLTGDPGERERRIDLLRYQVDEIKKSAIRSGEEEELNRQRTYLANAEKILSSLSSAYDLLYTGGRRGAALDLANDALTDISGICAYDERFEKLRSRLEDAIYQLTDVAEDIRRERDSVEFEPGMLDSIEERLDLIFRLKRKYGKSIEEVLEYCEKCERELTELEESTERIGQLERDLAETEEKLYKTAQKLHESRLEAARFLEEKIEGELRQLQFKNARFKVGIVFNDSRGSGPAEFTQNGLDSVEFMFSANAGEPLKPLARIASGGEMSRVMLAIKTILADIDGVPVLVFDEIDTGISGKTAQTVGEKLFFISTGRQVLCVTHLTQIACMADRHFLIEKVTHDNSTRTVVKVLEGADRRDEIARLLGGSSTSDITMKHSEEILEISKAVKNRILAEKRKTG